MAGRVQHAEAQLSKGQFLGVPQAAEGVLDPGGLVQAEVRAVLRCQQARARHVVGVDMRVDHVAQLKGALGQ